MNDESAMRDQAISIWKSAVAAVDPRELIRRYVAEHLGQAISGAKRILVVGGGKAGAIMALALEEALAPYRDRLEGIVNVPAETNVRPSPQPSTIRLHPARPAGSNHPTAEGVAGAEQMLTLLESANSDDIAICLLSGGGSALLPAPASGIALADKQALTKLLHGSGASINEMNCVRKHLSRIKGGRLAQAFRGRALYSLILSDVVGDPLDVIASGPTARDESTFADALTVIDRYQLREHVSPAIVHHLQEGIAGRIPETLKQSLAQVHHVLLGNNQLALKAAHAHAEGLGYRVLNLGSFIEGETSEVAVAIAGIVRSICRDGIPMEAPVCILLGGETTVTLTNDSGKGGRNQEFVLAMLDQLGIGGMHNVTVLSAGTDGEDGPTDATGGVADEQTIRRGKNLEEHLVRHNAYPYLEATNSLIRTGLTGTNVMDVRVVLIR